MQTTATGSGSAALQYQVAVERKSQDSVREQGKQALELIQAAAPASPPAGTGTRVNVVA
jgi:hypothetical protein